MLRLLKQFYRDLNNPTTKTSERGVFVESDYLKEKRTAAISYLGDKWIASKKNYIQHKEGKANEQVV